MINFSQEQKSYINSEIDKHVYLEACPGSGKTEVVAAKVVKEMEQWDKFPSGMAILSFANSATDELRDRITKYRKQSTGFYPHFVGTFDSFILKYIVSPISHEITGYAGDDGDFSIRVVESGSPIYIKTKYGIAGKGNQYANKYDFDLCEGKYIFSTGIPANDRALNVANLKGWEIRSLEDAKNIFLEKGFATYRDVEHLTIQLLKDKNAKQYIELVVQKFPLMIIDECQDLSHEQLYILELLSNLGVNIHFIGDLNQAIYGFRNADPQKVSDFIKKIDMEKLPLTKNFRSGQQIVDLCDLFVSSMKVEGEDNYAKENCVVLEYKNSPKEVIPTFLKLTGEHQNSVIVARGHATLNKFLNSATKLNVVESLALSIVLFDKEDMFKIEQSLTLFSEYLRENINDSEGVRPQSFNCPRKIDSSLRWRRFLFLAITHLVDKGLSNTATDWENWCKQVKTELRLLPDEVFIDRDICELLGGLKKVNHPAPKGKGAESIGDTLKINSDLEYEYLRLTTIHKVKGETHDATMLVSSVRAGNESHWKDWFKDSTSEAARLAYVACSRPKHLLILAVKKVSGNEKKELEAKGFVFKELI